MSGIVVEDFYPKELEFTFDFSIDTCHKLKTGICELDEINLTSIEEISYEELKLLSTC